MGSHNEFPTIFAINTAILRLLLIYGGIPLAIGGVALSVLVFRFAKYRHRPYSDQDRRLDITWLGINVFIAPAVALVIYIIWLIQDMRAGVRDAGSLLLFLPAGICSLVVTFFALAIPLRLAMNVIVRERRSRYRLESIALVVTFAALAWMLYIFWTVPAEG